MSGAQGGAGQPAGLAVSSALGQAGFRIGMFVFMTSGLLLLVLDRSTAEFVLMVAMLGCSSLFLIVLAVFARLLPKR